MILGIQLSGKKLKTNVIFFFNPSGLTWVFQVTTDSSRFELSALQVNIDFGNIWYIMSHSYNITAQSEQDFKKKKKKHKSF